MGWKGSNDQKYSITETLPSLSLFLFLSHLPGLICSTINQDPLGVMPKTCTLFARRFLRTTAHKYRESHDRKENSDFLLWLQKDPFGELFSEIYFQGSSEFTFLWNLGKFEIQLNQPRWPMEFVQNCTCSTRQYRKKGTCLDFIFTRFVTYPLVILLS